MNLLIAEVMEEDNTFLKEQNKRNARLQGLSRENETLSPALTIPPHLNAPAHEWNTPVGNYTLL